MASGLGKHELLHSDRLWLVDVEVTETQVNAGWVYLDGDLKPVEQVGEFEIVIPESIQKITFPSEFYLPDDVIEFRRC